MDQVICESQNRYRFVYFERLAAWWLFHSVTVSFFPIGHSYEEIYQALCCKSDRLQACKDTEFERLTAELLLSTTKTLYYVHFSILQIFQIFVMTSNVCNLSGVSPLLTFLSSVQTRQFPLVIFFLLPCTLFCKKYITEFVYNTNERSCCQKWKYLTSASALCYCKNFSQIWPLLLWHL